MRADRVGDRPHADGHAEVGGAQELGQQRDDHEDGQQGARVAQEPRPQRRQGARRRALLLAAGRGGCLLALAHVGRLQSRDQLGHRAQRPADRRAAARPRAARPALAARARRARRRSRPARGPRRAARRRTARSVRSRCDSSAPTSSSIPRAGGRQETITTSVSVALPAPATRSARSRRARSATAAEVGLVDHQHIGDLHDSGLEELQHVARPGLDHHRDGVGHLGHVGLRLAHAHRLDHHHVERRRQRLSRGPRGRGQPAQLPASRRGADEHRAVGGIERDPRAVAQQRAPRAPRGGVHRQHRDTAVLPAPGSHQLRQQ